MVLDIPAVATFLRLNGLSNESPEADVRALLRTAHYSEQEITAFLGATRGPNKTYSVYLPPMVEEETVQAPTGMPYIPVTTTSAMPPAVAAPVPSHATFMPPAPRAPEYTVPTYRVPKPDPVQKVVKTVHAESVLSRFKGRMSRENFALGTLALFVVSILLLLVAQALQGVPFFLFLICLPILGGALIVGASMNIRRLHDLGHPGEMAIISLVPYVNIAFWLYLLIKRGEPKENAYGKEAKEVPFIRAIVGKA